MTPRPCAAPPSRLALLGWAGIAFFGASLVPARADDASSAPSAGEVAPDFARDVAPILHRECAVCHRPGRIGPMSLLTYEEARPWAKSIREAVTTRAMPPWLAAPPSPAFRNDRSLSDAEIAAVVAWVDAGAPMGDPTLAPPPPALHDEWILGEPDAVVGMDAPVEVAAEGRDDYRCFVLDPALSDDTWVTAVEVRPENHAMTHHVVLYVDKNGTGEKRDREDPGPGYECFGGPGFMAAMLGGWGPGMDPKVYPEGTGHEVPGGAKIVMQMHYHRTGRIETDRTIVGLHYSDGKGPDGAPLKAMRDGLVLEMDLRIRPGDAESIWETERRVMRPIVVHSVQPHMHLLGKSVEMWATLPDGSRVELVNVPRWDFHWQLEYAFAEPIRLPGGSRVHVRGVFDNSAENPAQPSQPPRMVRFGEETTDEMLVGVYNYVMDEGAGGSAGADAAASAGSGR